MDSCSGFTHQFFLCEFHMLPKYGRSTLLATTFGKVDRFTFWLKKGRGDLVLHSDNT